MGMILSEAPKPVSETGVILHSASILTYTSSLLDQQYHCFYGKLYYQFNRR
jgi:hypothetical protein